MIKRLAACIREYKRPTILTPVCMVGEVVCECTIPLLTADLINAIQNGCTMQTILSFGLKLFVIAMLSLGFGSLSGWFAAEAAAGVSVSAGADDVQAVRPSSRQRPSSRAIRRFVCFKAMVSFFICILVRAL